MHLLTVAETAQKLRLSVFTIYKWTSQKKMPGLVKLGTRTMIDESAVDEWLQELRQRQEQPAEGGRRGA